MPKGGTDLRTLLLGLDGACRPVLDRLADADAVPTLEELWQTGYADGLTSQIPPWTPSAWPSLYTGVNPGKHGVYGFLAFEGYDWSVVDRTDVREHALWGILDDHGVSSVVVNVPVTHPPREIDGAVVPGYVAPEDPECVPGDALDSVPAGGDYRLYPPKSGDVTRTEQLSAFESLVESRGRVFRQLAAEHEPGFGFLQFQVTDTVFHERPEDWDAIERVYRAVDEQVEATLSACDPDNVIVVSDHGIGKYGGHEFRVNEFLRDRGYVETVRGGEGMPSWDSLARNQLREGEAGNGRDSTLVERVAAAAASVGLTSQRIERILDAVGLAEVVAEVAPTDAVRAATEQVDFPDSQAYMRSRIELGVRLNLAGREPDGTVPPDRYEAVRATLIAAFEDVTTPDGQPVFEAVRPRETVFNGPYLERAPDIVLVPAGYDHFLSGSLLGEQFGTPREPWNHKRTGVIVARGTGIDETAGTDRPHLFDVAPTVLATFGVAPSDRMDGEALPIVERIEPKPYPEFNARANRTADDETVEQHLADLGYLEDV